MKKLQKGLIMVLLLAGCSHVISGEVRENVDPGFSVEEFFRNPGSYNGKTVILGGLIVNSRNADKGSYIEVLQKPLDRRGLPEETDLSYGRFVAFSQGFLDKNIYSAGKRITVAGVVTGKMKGNIDEMEYEYPLIRIEEVRLHRASGGVPVRFSIGIWHIF